jgi:hypothetical protein
MALKICRLVLAASILVSASNAVGAPAKPAEAATGAALVAQGSQTDPATASQSPSSSREATGQTATSVGQITKDSPAPTPTPSPTPDVKQINYSYASVGLAVGVLVLLAFLFIAMVWWSNRLERASYLGVLYHDTVEEMEYNRLAGPFTRKWLDKEYQEEVKRDVEWLSANPRPPRPQDPPGFSSTSPSDEERKLVEEHTKRYWDAMREYEPRKQEWDLKVWSEAAVRYRKDLDAARTKAKDRAGRAADVDFAVLRGRGAEFVLEFTTIVVIIFAATALGILGILDTQQIGTLLAAIAGYVLGRATTRSRSGAGEKAGAEEEKRTPVSTSDITELIKVVAGITRQPGQPPKPETDTETESRPDKSNASDSSREQNGSREAVEPKS